jgi:1-acyl-sn-glycerol-3-phosphate acyltransferase
MAHSQIHPGTPQLTDTRPPSLCGFWALLCFIFLTLCTLVLVLVLPRQRWRSAAAHFTARLFLKFAGIRLSIRHLDRLPRGTCVVIANHASYLDGVVIKAALPARFGFVIKKEISKVPLAGGFLRLIGSEFVDRFNRHSGGIDALRLLRTARQGKSLGFFPEGTITSERGIAHFHAGAFVIAARAKLPVVPVAICGTRSALPLGTAWLKPGSVIVSVLEPIAAEGCSAAALRDQSRGQILAAVSEPDLAKDAVHSTAGMAQLGSGAAA